MIKVKRFEITMKSLLKKEKEGKNIIDGRFEGSGG